MSPTTHEQIPLSVKNVRPRARRDDLVRDDLIRRLPSGREGSRVTQVLAPAGWGKSTLLATWIASLGETASIAYVSIDGADADVGRLLTYLSEALADVVPGLNRTPLDSGPRWVDEVAAAITSSGERPIIVLDDLHRLQSDEGYRLLEAMIDRLPEGTRFVVSSRADPPIALARLRAQRDVEEIRMADLAMDADETDGMLRSCFSVELTRADLATIVAKTEGWPAAISLAGLSLRSTADEPLFVAEFAGTSRLIFDYLTEEVLLGLDSELRDFMVRSSVLTELSPALCTAVTGRTDSAEALDVLERNSSFLISLDQQREWYRFHHLVADRLGAELRDEQERKKLHRRAAEWLAVNDREEHAVAHLLAAGDVDMAAQIIGRIGYEFLFRGRYTTVLQWIEVLPDHVLDESPDLAVLAGFACLFLQDFGGTRRWIHRSQHIEQDPAHQLGTLSLEGNLLNAEGRLEAMGAVADRIEELVRDVVPAIRPDQRPIVAEAIITPAVASLLANDFDEARRLAEMILSLSRGTANAGPTVIAHGILAFDAWRAGHASIAQQHLDAADGLATTGQLEPYAIHRLVPVIVAGLYGDAEQREGAIDWLGRVLDYSPYGFAYALVIEGRHALSLGDIDTARQALDEASELAHSTVDQSPTLAVDIAALRTSVDEAAGDTPVAADPDSLTDRELQILRALAGNLTQREIGREFYLAFNTVKGYVRSAYRKLGVNSRTDAVQRCRELGLI